MSQNQPSVPATEVPSTAVDAKREVSPPDLPAASDAHIKGGPSGSSTSSGSTRLNHNESIALDATPDCAGDCGSSQ